MKNKILFYMIVLVLETAGIAFAGSKGLPAYQDQPSRVLTVFKTSACMCCDNHIAFLRSRNFDVAVVLLDAEGLDNKKLELGIPVSLDSCHTTVSDSGNYFIEGHMPSEAIEKLISEKPDIRGISLPGMPSASPGMPGGKTGPFVIRQVSHEGTVSTFMVL